MDLEKLKKEREWLRKHELTAEDLQKLIRDKLERAERYHFSLKEREHRAELD